ncbi:hypothetical protein CDAR_2451 [Caerostris darwini]|uniref:Uncharacterized protein n=1 Tax=Caerostris darwini TaxID=1538125 RepID=A0AAV4W8X8_9ARAC|nr:hypothetical protein CDAR_2451 [Caerostris darwini]
MQKFSILRLTYAQSLTLQIFSRAENRKGIALSQIQQKTLISHFSLSCSRDFNIPVPDWVSRRFGHFSRLASAAEKKDSILNSLIHFGTISIFCSSDLASEP